METADNRVWKKAYLPKGWDAKLPVPMKRDSGAARLREPILLGGEWAFDEEFLNETQKGSST
jgi:hypothetical protein